MKKCIIVIVLIINFTSSECRLIEELFGAIRNKTHTIKNDIAGAVHYGKNVIFGDHQENADKGKQLSHTGLIDKISLRIHNIAVDAREHFRAAIAIFAIDENGKGPIGRIFDRMKTHIINVKSFLHGDTKQKGVCAANNNTNVLCEKLKDYVYKNSSSSNNGVRKTVHTLKDIVDKIRNNITKYKQKNDQETDGTGLIDIRISPGDIVQDNTNNVDNRVKVIYDKVDGLN